MTTKAVGIMQDGEVVWHAIGVYHDYDSLCGIDANDPKIGHEGSVPAKRGQKITCAQCHTIWRNIIALRLREGSFDLSTN